MSVIDPVVLQQLSRSRFRVRSARARAGVGERPSGVASSGIEFADHRPYEPGDDLRHVDHHVFARTGQHVVRRYVSHAALDVAILVDVSASMAFGGTTSKLRHAERIAAVLTAVGIAGGDRVTVGTFRDHAVAWHAPVAGVQRMPEVFAWLDGLKAGGRTDFDAVAAASAPQLRPHGLLFVVSDWMGQGVPSAVATWRNLGQELVLVHVIAEEDLLHEEPGGGSIRLVDAETGETVDVVLDASTVASYREDHEAFRAQLARSATSHEGRYLVTSCSDDVAHLALHAWRANGLIA